MVKMKPYKATYEIIKELLNKRNIDKRILATRTGINYNTIRSYIDSAKNIPLENLKKIAKALNVSVSYLLGEITDDEIRIENAIQEFNQNLKSGNGLQIYYKEIEPNLFLVKIDR